MTVTYKLATDKDELTCEITAKPVGEATPGAFLFGAIVCMRKYVCVSVRMCMCIGMCVFVCAWCVCACASLRS